MSEEMIEKEDMMAKDVAMNEVTAENEGREDDKDGRSKGKTYFRKKVCRFCAQKANIIRWGNPYY